ncbi:MAG TPA: DNA (cytosine-5-)-methyltransferase [Cyanothece sp. UBA12306]|nr:DNA (cytosine-5-)-methyltransferase [Cyanothece sp. UBA12306]
MTKLTLNQASEFLGISPDLIRTWEKKKLIKSEKNHQIRLFDLELLQRVYNSWNGQSQEIGFKVLQSDQKTDLTVIELFAGCGGMALGLENSGLKTQLLVEINKDCVNTLQKNRPNWQVMQEDVSKIDFKPYQNKIDIVSGGFPCQAFSYAGKGKGFEDTRGTLFFEFARCLAEIKPKIALAENVRGLLSHQQGKTLSIMLKSLEQLGYKPSYKVISTQFLDVPQKRERVVIIAVRKDLAIPAIFPTPKNYTISLREALKNCPDSIGTKYKEQKKAIMELVPPGGNWKDLPLDIQKKYLKNSFFKGGGRTGFAKRLSWDEPCLTITCSPAQTQTERCHPDETRPLTVREYARVQTFPDDWEFTGSLTTQYKQIGNAVPVNMSYHLGKCLIAMLEKKWEHYLQLEIISNSDKKVEQLAIPGLVI